MDAIGRLAYAVDSFLIAILVLGILVLMYLTTLLCLSNRTLPAEPAGSQAAGVQPSTATSTDQVQPPQTSAARNMFIINIFGNNSDNNNNKLEPRDDDPCAICLSGCKADMPEVWRVLPRCKHGFHVHCILKWLETNETCPICRDSVFSI